MNLSWQVGRFKIVRLIEMGLPVPAVEIPEATPEELSKMRWLYPHFVSDDSKILKLSVQTFLVEAEGFKLVVDTCVGNDRPRKITDNKPLATPFLQHLAEASWSREDVDAVVCTHLHADHVGWNTMLENGQWTPTFPRARYLVGRLEYAFWRETADKEQRAVLNESIRPIFDAGLMQLVEQDHEICPGVRLLPSAGHTPGHVCVLLESEGERAVITGDMAHHPSQIAHCDWSLSDHDRRTAALTRSGLFAEWADKPVLVIGTHFAHPTAGYVVSDGASLRFDVTEQNGPELR